MKELQALKEENQKLKSMIKHSIKSHEWFLDVCSPFLAESADKRSVKKLVRDMKKLLNKVSDK